MKPPASPDGSGVPFQEGTHQPGDGRTVHLEREEASVKQVKLGLWQVRADREWRLLQDELPSLSAPWFDPDEAT
jgi:hypothetical protein